MKRCLFSFLLIPCLWAADLNTAHLQKADQMHLVVDTADHIAIPKPLSDTFDQLGIKHDGKIQGIVTAAQKKWLRKKGQERWNIPPIAIQDKARFIRNCRSLGLIDEISPTKKHYEYCVVLGAAVPGIKVRLAHLMKLWNNGVRFNQLIFLTSERTLDLAYEGQKTLLYSMPDQIVISPLAAEMSMPQTEAEAMAFYYQNSHLPQDLKSLPLKIITTKSREILPYTKRRATSGDTVLSWLESRPKPGAVLAISSQPFVGYQFAILRHVLPKSFALDVVGPETSRETNPGIFLDTIARWMFAETCEFD